jgi:hypothetical protein
MKEILKKHMQEELPEELKPKKKKWGLPVLASSFALLAVVVVSFQLSVKSPETKLADQWWQDFDREIDQEMELVLAELDSI